MNIFDIKSPKFLKKMNVKELENLSFDIRNFIIENVSKTGGHLSSNLGVVDLTICLHKVFDFSKDKLFFDVSHQCYTHKILTGRANKFSSLRSLNGLSGFSKRSESIYDPYESGHSSTSISTSVGYAIARDMNHDNYNIVSIIGDGSISNGLAYEAINHLGSINSKVIIILNDNEMSISKNVGALHNSLDRIRANSKYNSIKSKTKYTLSKIPIIGKFIYNITHYTKKLFKLIYNKNGILFEELGLKYYGPINGHDYNEMLLYLNMAKKEKNSVILHVITNKGKGYLPCMNDTLGIWHGVDKFDVKTGEFLKKDNKLITWSEVISNHLIYITKKNKNIVVITPAMAGGSKLLKYKEIFPHNFIDVGICEEHALTCSSGLSLGGKIPVVVIYSTFLQRAYDQIIHDIARMDLHTIICVDRCGIVGNDGESHQGIYDVSFLLPIPNLIISIPSNAKEAGDLLYTASKNNHPFVIRYSKNSIEDEKSKYKEIKIGKWECINKGSNGTIITYGDFVNNAILVNNKLKNDNINLSIINALFIKPIDIEMLENIIKDNKPIFIYEEVINIGSFGMYLLSIINKYNFKNKVYLFNIKDSFVKQGNNNEVLEYLELDVDSIYNKIKNILL